jgi:UDP-glucuronate decarboxylase
MAPSLLSNKPLDTAGLRRRHGASAGSSNAFRFNSKQVITLLGVGIFVGYALLPTLFVDLDLDASLQNAMASVAEKNLRPASTLETRSLSVEKALSEVEQRLVQDYDILGTQSLPTSTTPYVMKTQKLPDHQRKKILVTGGAGFVGSHLVDKLMMEGHEVTVVDNFFTGQKKNIAHWLHHPHFSLRTHDVTEEIMLEVDQIYHMACPASPPHYQYNPVKTIKTSTMGTINMLGLAKRVKARILLTSTSEIYGDPQVHPQPESYWGNVNTIGPRACYDEGKRVAETMMIAYKQQNDVDIRIARIFNTFGPRMHPNDGRVVSNFIIQALQNKDLTIYGSGDQTRSFQYVSDLVDGLHALMNSDYDGPVNLGNPQEYTIKDFAEYIQQLTSTNGTIIKLPKSQDDPSQRRPDITTAKSKLRWSPKVKVEDGLLTTIEYFQKVLDEHGEIIPTGPGAAKPEA